MVKIGDRVRFLNAIGGGIVRSFLNKETVNVEEDDGFETPVLVKECVIIQTAGELSSNKNTVAKNPDIEIRDTTPANAKETKTGKDRKSVAQGKSVSERLDLRRPPLM